jgi:tRNA 2-thiouridine synthesizing protein A
MKADVILDVQGLHSPIPVIKIKKAIDAIHSGQVLGVISTDPGTKSDISVLLHRLGHELLQVTEKGGIAEFYIEKK